MVAQVAGDLQAKELRYKRGLPTTTISPERRNPQRKKEERAGVPARKSLGFGGTSQSVLDRTLSDLRWLKTVSSNFQDVDFDGSLLPLFIN